MPPKKTARGGAAKKTPTKAAEPPKVVKKEEEPVPEETAVAEEEKEPEVKDEPEEQEGNDVTDENGHDNTEEGGEEAEGDEMEEGGEENAEGEEEGGEEKEGEETKEGETKEGEKKEETKEGEKKDEKKDQKKKPRFNPQNRTVAVHEYHMDRMSNVHDRTILVGPTNLEDLQNEKLISYLTEKAVQFFIRYSCKPEVKGHVEIRFKTVAEAKEAAVDLQTLRENIVACQNTDEFQKSEKHKELKNLWGSQDEGSATQRTLVLKGIPTDVTAEQLEEKIPDAVQIIIPQRGTPATFQGFAYVEFATQEEADKKVEEKIKFPDSENEGEEREAVFRKFDSVPGIDLLIKKIDGQHFDKPMNVMPNESRQQLLNQLISYCGYYDRNNFLLRQRKHDALKKRKQMLIQRRDEIKKMQRAMSRQKKMTNRGGRGGGRGGMRGGMGGRPGPQGGPMNQRPGMKRPGMQPSPRGAMGGNFANKRMRRDSFGRGGGRMNQGPMPTGPRIPRDAWQNNNWGNSGGNMGGGYNSNMGGGSGFGNSGGFNSNASFQGNMGSMGGGNMGGGLGSDMGGGGFSNTPMNRMDNYSTRDNFYDDGGMGSGNMGGASNFSGRSSGNYNDYDDMGRSSYGGNYGGNQYNDNYDNYGSQNIGGQQAGRKSLNPQQAANAINLLAGLSTLMGRDKRQGSGGTGGNRFGGNQKGGRW